MILRDFLIQTIQNYTVSHDLRVGEIVDSLNDCKDELTMKFLMLITFWELPHIECSDDGDGRHPYLESLNALMSLQSLKEEIITLTAVHIQFLRRKD